MLLTAAEPPCGGVAPQPSAEPLDGQRHALCKAGFMRPSHLYLVLAVAGTALPYAFLVPFLRDYGLDAPELAAQLFANDVSAFFGMDVAVSALVLFLFVALEGGRLRLRRLWLPVVGTMTVGVSLGLPLFLYLRERRLEDEQRAI